MDFANNKNYQLGKLRMSGIVVNEIIAKLPSKCPIPDYSGRSSLSPTHNPQTDRGLIHLPSPNILLDEISKLRKENKELRQEMGELKVALRENSGGKRARSKPIFQKQQSHHSGKQKSSLKVADNENIVVELKKDKQKLQIVLGENSAKLLKLEAQNKTLREIIGMNIELTQDNLRKENRDLQARMREIVAENQVLKESLGEVERKMKENDERKRQLLRTQLKKQQMAFQNGFERMSLWYQKIMKECESVDMKINIVEEATHKVRANMSHFNNLKNSNKSKDNNIQDSLENGEKQMTTTHYSPLTKSIIYKSTQIQTDETFSEQTKHQYQKAAQHQQALVAQLQQTNQQLSRMTNLLKQYQTQISQKDNSISLLKTTISTLNTQITHVEQQLRNTKHKAYFSDDKQTLDLRMEIEELKRIIELSQRPINSTLEQLGVKDELIGELREQLLHSRQIIKRLEEELENVNNNQNGIGMEMIDEINEVKEQLNVFMRENKEMNAGLVRSSDDIERLTCENEELKAYNNDLSIQNKNLKTKQEQSSHERILLESRNKDNQTMIIKLRDGLNQLEMLSKQLEDKNRQLQQILQVKQRNLEDVQNRYRQIEMYNQELRMEAGSKDSFLLEIFQEVDKVKQILLEIDFGALQSSLRNYSVLNKEELKKRINKIYQLENELKQMKLYKQNAIKLEQKLMETEFERQKISNNLEAEKISNVKLHSEIQQLRSSMNEYISKQIDNRRTPKKNVSASERLMGWIDNIKGFQELGENLEGIRRGVDKAEEHVTTAIKKRY